MPTYSYICSTCEAPFEVTKSIQQYKNKEKCPFCHKICNVTRDFFTDNVYSGVRLALSEIKKLHHYAERQSQEYGKAKCDEIAKEFKTKKKPSGRTKMTEDDYVKMPSRKKKR